MADVRLTDEQQAAVDDRGRSLLVSAAAGSGKTKVLVERLFSYVEREGANLDEFLIITYTRAAASELRGKIAAALSERLRLDPGNAHLQRQLMRVYRADIKTVDAFCTALLRENCHLLSEDGAHRTLRPDFRVLDEQDAAALRARVLARTLDRFYEGLEPGDGGTLLADTLGAGRDDRALAALVGELYDKVQSQAYPERWLADTAAMWENLPAAVDETPFAALLLGGLRDKALHWARLLEQGADEMVGDAKLSASYAPDFRCVAGALRALAAAAERGWDDARSHLVAFPRITAARKVEDEALKTRMKRLWDNCKASVGKFDGWFTASSAEAAADLRAMSGAMTALLGLTGDFLRAYAAEKRRRNAADFSDQEHLAIQLLLDGAGKPTELARTVGARYREIMVDEYQDTNEVQNRIFEAISRDGSNLFTVGDVKQSIYRFRLADPTIFLDHYNTYPRAAEAKAGERAKLLLSRNFRSRAEVLDATNFVFSNILSREMGELDYGADEALYAGANYEENPTCATEFHLLSTQRGSGVRAGEAEAAFVADYIRALLDGGFTVTDDATRQQRPVREEDIVILMRSPRARIADYRRALESCSVGLCAEAPDDLFATVEVAAVFSLLEVLDNPRQDVPLIAVLRSPLFGFSADRLALLRGAYRDGDYYDALLNGTGEDVEGFLNTLRALRTAAQSMSVRRLLAHCYDTLNVLGVFGAMPRGRERKENLLAFLALAARFEDGGYRGLFAFVSHLRDLRQSGESEAGRGAQSVSGVRLMSIHKSKGLEFPVVILADLAKAFNNMDFTGAVLVHPKYGIGPDCVDVSRRIRYPTVARQAIERTLRRETKAEELRLLYVAMTRAKEKLVMVHTQSGAAKRVGDLLGAASCPALPETVDEGKCLGDWVMLPLLCRPEAQPLRDLAGFGASRLTVTDDRPWIVAVHEADGGEETPREAPAAPAEAPPSPELTGDLDALAWVYPHAAAVELSAKLTATQLKGREADAEIAEHAKLPPRLRSLAKPRFLAGETALTGAERGTAIHLVMEHLDFACEPTETAVRAAIDAIWQRRLLTREQAEAADESVIARFLQSPLARRIRASRHVEREYRFSILSPARDFDPRADEADQVLLQGVADCFFEEDGELVVLDFKTDRITTAQTAERAAFYRPQLDAYGKALERIFGMRVRQKLLYFFHTGECVSAEEGT